MTRNTASKASHDATLPSTGAQCAAYALKSAGITKVFALCGDHVNSLFHAVSAAGIEIVGTRHESAAVQMADGWARATGRPGVAIVTGGPGHTNAVTGAAVAQCAQSPVLVISGQAPKARRERGGNQSLHQANIMRPVTKWAAEAEDGTGLRELVTRALMVAKSDTPGAVSLSIPVDVADSKVDALLDAAPTIPTTAFWQQVSRAPLAPSDADLDAAVKALHTARRPVIVLGRNPFQHACCDLLETAVRRLGMPTFTNGHSRGVVADDGKTCFGFARARFNKLFSEASEADLWLVVGTAIDYNIASVVSRSATVIQIHHDPKQIGVGRLPTHALVGGSAITIDALANALPTTPKIWDAWRARFQAGYLAQTAYWDRKTEDASRCGEGIHPASLCAVLRQYWTPDTTLVVDVGDFINWPRAYFPALSPTRYMDGGALGNLGGALPIGIGAQIARPEQPVWVFIGDGGLGFYGWELSIAAEHALPLKVFVGNDRAWGTEKRLQRNSYETDIACDLPAIRYDRFAELQGVRGLHATDHSQLTSAVTELMAHEGPCLVNLETVQLAGRPYAETP